MTVKELKEILKDMNDDLEVIIEVTEWWEDEDGDDCVSYYRNEQVDHFEFNDTKFYLVGQMGDTKGVKKNESIKD